MPVGKLKTRQKEEIRKIREPYYFTAYLNVIFGSSKPILWEWQIFEGSF